MSFASPGNHKVSARLGCFWLSLAALPLLAPVLVRGEGEHSLIKARPYNWARVDGKAGSWPGMGSDTLNFTVRSPAWRIRLRSEQGDGNKGRIRVNLWAGELQDGKTIYRSIGSIYDNFAGRDDLDVVYTARTLPGTYDDGTPRPFRLGISGTRAHYEVIVEDDTGVRADPPSPASLGDPNNGPDKGTGKSKPAPPAKKK